MERDIFAEALRALAEDKLKRMGIDEVVPWVERCPAPAATGTRQETGDKNVTSILPLL